MYPNIKAATPSTNAARSARFPLRVFDGAFFADTTQVPTPFFLAVRRIFPSTPFDFGPYISRCWIPASGYFMLSGSSAGSRNLMVLNNPRPRVNRPWCRNRVPG